MDDSSAAHHQQFCLSLKSTTPAMPDIPDSQILLSLLPADGSPVGNITLRNSLAWDYERYYVAKQELVLQGRVATGKGKGGSLMRSPSVSSAGSTAFKSSTAEIFGTETLISLPPSKTSLAGSLRDQPITAMTSVTTYQHSNASRKNIPPAGIATPEAVDYGPHRLSYDPHLSPVLRFDSSSGTDRLTARVESILEKSRSQPLTPEETQFLSEALLRSRQPWLEWAGKHEKRWFEVDPVALHIHERVSANAILKAARREDIEHDLFADPKLSREEVLQFYKHDVDWANRLILGDSLQVMSSLARREGLAGKVQMIYIDPPYGIKFSSNWQNEVGKRDIKDSNDDLTREPEMIKAYRDTWTLGVHSYLDYLKQRLIVARELLADSGSVFVQISDENLHRVRAVMDEVFGADNFVSGISFATTTGFSSNFLSNITDFIIWYSKKRNVLKFNQLYRKKVAGEEGATKVKPLIDVWPELAFCRDPNELGTADQFTSQGSSGTPQSFTLHGIVYEPPAGMHWKTSSEGAIRLAKCYRLRPEGNRPRYVRLLSDFDVFPINNAWMDIGGVQNRDEGKLYTVQTATEVIQRCLLMTTDPGDLVLDPTCGSGTSAYVAESWGRRWITIDSSRVAVAIARQRLLTAKFETYKTKDISEGVDADKPKNPGTGFHYKTVPHITLKSIAQNKSLDPIFDKHEPILAEKLAKLNQEVSREGAKELSGEDLRQVLVRKLIAKHQEEGGRAVTDADQRRWLLPGTDPQLIQPLKSGKGLSAISLKQAEAYREAIPATAAWQEWEVPFDTDSDWPQPLRDALTAYRQAWRAKMDEVNSCIEANADQEELVDQPEIVKSVVRVTGPFTVESVRPLEDSLKGNGHEAADSPIIGAQGELEDSFYVPERDVTNAASHIERMIALLRTDGLTFTGNKHLKFERLDPIESEFLHADGETLSADGLTRKVAVVIGPEHGSVGSFQVNTAVSSAIQRGYDDIIFAAFAFDAASQDRIHETNENPANKLNAIMAQIRPDVLLGDLLKGNKAGGKAAETAKASQQLFTVFGQPRTRVEQDKDGYIAHMDGVDVYDPVKNSIEATKAGKVAAWFLDSDYDGRTFCICQAFFPDRTVWEKLAKALSGTIDPAAFEAFSGTKSLPFHAGEHRRVAIKVIDPRGNEVMRVHSLP
jgi:adenine-specific DNA-methyltransferase